MGWRGALRTAGAIARASERDAQRRLRMELAEKATRVANSYEQLIEDLTSLHKECSSAIDWNARANAAAPEKVERAYTNESNIKSRIINYKPNFFEKTFNLVEKKKKKLSEMLIEAQQKDEDIFNGEVIAYENEFKKWELNVAYARRVLAGDIATLKDVLSNSAYLLSDLASVGRHANFKFIDANTIKIELRLNDEDIMPNESYKALKSGKLSVKDISKGQFNQMYQDHACSCILRVASEVFACLPTENIIVTAKKNLLDPATGSLLEKTVASVFIPRKTLLSLNLETIDPSASMKNFIHNMDFKKTTGFGVVEEVNVPNITNRV